MVPAQEAPTLTTMKEVEASIGALVGRLGSLDGGYRAMLPARRTIEARCTDLGLMYHALWRDGQLGKLLEGPADRADICIHVASTDLASLADGSLAFRDAYVSQRLRIDASVTDLLRLRAIL